MYAIGCDIESVQTDGHGMIPESLNAILSNWRHERAPKVIYTIPTGQNPSGSTMPLSRRMEVLEIAKNYDLLVIEDDPYWHMQYNKGQFFFLFSSLISSIFFSPFQKTPPIPSGAFSLSTTVEG